jgi:hypothetical protein
MKFAQLNTASPADLTPIKLPCFWDDDGVARPVGKVVFSIVGTFTGTYVAQLSFDGGSTFATVGLTNALTRAVVANATAAGVFECSTEGASHVQIIPTALSAGSATVTGNTVTVPR